MNELLKKLFETDLLSAETKTQLEEAFASQLTDVIAEAKATTEETVRLELAEQWLATRETLIEAIDAKVTDMVAEEFKELQGSIEEYKDLEVEFANKLTEAKVELGIQVKADMAQLIEKLDTFLEDRISEEFVELKTDIAEAKKNDFGRRVVEAFMDEYQAKFVDQNEVTTKLEEAQSQLQTVTSKLNEATATRAKLERTLKLENLLAPLSGPHRQLMETILSNYDTKELDKAYTKFIGRVLKEAATPSEKEDKVLAEGADQAAGKTVPVVKTGDTVMESQNEKTAETVLSEGEKRQLQRMAGIVN